MRQRRRMRRVRRYGNARAGRRRFAALCGAAVTVIAVLLLDALIRPALYACAAAEGHNAAQRIINAAVEQTIAAQGEALSDAVRVTHDAQGRVTGITTDVVQLNLLKAQVTGAIEAAFAAGPRVTAYIPLGAATHVALLAGRGPRVPVRIALSATAETAFESAFSAAGVNQTLHSVLLRVHAQVTVLLPRGAETQEIETAFCAAQSVIVGSVPEVSLNRS